MANSVVDICNLALARVRANSIGALTDQSPQAEKCRIYYPEARKMVLSSVWWPFNKKTRSLAKKTFKPAQWQYAYAYPSDCLMVRKVIPSELPLNSSSTRYLDNRFVDFDEYTADFEVELGEDDTKIISTNQDEAMVIYSVDIETVSTFGHMVTELIAWRMAKDLAIVFGGDAGRSYRDNASREFEKLKSEASAMYSNQASPRQKQQLPRSVRARSTRPRSAYDPRF